MQHLVFVYGTLRRGECNHSYLDGCKLVGLYETAPEYALYNLGPYPGLSVGHTSVTGEVYQIGDETLAELDLLEDIPYEYRRESIHTPFGEAWIYLYQDASKLHNEIASGDWCQRI